MTPAQERTTRILEAEWRSEPRLGETWKHNIFSTLFIPEWNENRRILIAAGVERAIAEHIVEVHNAQLGTTQDDEALIEELRADMRRANGQDAGS